MAGTADTAWAPLASARLVGQWPRAGIETSVLRGAAAPRTETTRRSCRHATARPRGHRCSRCPASPSWRSRARRAPRPTRLPTTRYWARSASPTTASRPGSWPRFGSGRRRPRGSRTSPRSNGASAGWAAWPCATCSNGHPTRRWMGSTRPRLASKSTFPHSRPPCGAGRLDLRAALTAGSSSLTGPGVNSRVSGRVGLIDNTALTGETELGITGSDGQVLRALRVTTDMPVVPTTRLQLSYTYRAGAQFPSARCSKRASCGGSTWAGSQHGARDHHTWTRACVSPRPQFPYDPGIAGSPLTFSATCGTMQSGRRRAVRRRPARPRIRSSSACRGTSRVRASRGDSRSFLLPVIQTFGCSNSMYHERVRSR